MNIKKINKKETWKPVKGYEGLYEVSSLGRVKALPKQKRHVRREKHEERILTTKERLLIRSSRPKRIHPLQASRQRRECLTMESTSSRRGSFLRLRP